MSLHEQHMAIVDSATEYTIVTLMPSVEDLGISELETKLQALLPDLGITIQKDAVL